MNEIGRLVSKLDKMKSVRAAILFGSCAKGKERRESDIDICVITDEKDDEPLGLSSGKYDISLYFKLPLYVRYRVFKEGRVLINKDDRLLTKLRFWTIKSYLDEKYWRDRFVKRVLS